MIPLEEEPLLPSTIFTLGDDLTIASLNLFWNGPKFNPLYTLNMIYNTHPRSIIKWLQPQKHRGVINMQDKGNYLKEQMKFWSQMPDCDWFFFFKLGSEIINHTSRGLDFVTVVCVCL